MINCLNLCLDAQITGDVLKKRESNENDNSSLEPVIV